MTKQSADAAVTKQSADAAVTKQSADAAVTKQSADAAVTKQPNEADTWSRDLGELHDSVAARLRDADQRYTDGRRRLVEALARAARPVRLPDIESMVPDLARSTAYRNLEALERCGIVQRLETGGERAYFELAESLLGHHHHLICVSCGAISDIELDSETEIRIDHALAAAARESGFMPLRHNLDLYGRCGDCEAER
ncbi:Fur family transcriptional regulator [Candidatus Poriferisodalis sp.]|uniref:Fur family transcriptional regulator n=1 Tax=Candidatus Poriferisodalis sp. TaxID=3101277 RepID=UPI003AF4C8F1